MEKSDKKRILTRVLIVIAALTLLSCCFLGSTFARYVTSAGGSGTVSVAKWDVSVAPSAGGTYTFNKLSPDKDSTNTGTHSTGTVEILTVTNNGDVDAEVTWTTSLAPKFREGATSDGNYSTYSGQFENMFSVKVTNSAGDAVLSAKQAESDADSLTLSAEVIWTTTSDVLDTWYGKWLESITVTFTFTATQNSELPTTPAP